VLPCCRLPPRATAAETYPARPVRIIVGSAVGDGTDLTARLIGQWLSERLGQPFIVENRPGAASNLAAEMVAHAPGDGYTLLLINPTNAINATPYDHLNFISVTSHGSPASCAYPS